MASEYDLQLAKILGIAPPEPDLTQEPVLADPTTLESILSAFSGLEQQPMGPARTFGEGFVGGLGRGLGGAGTRVAAQRQRFEEAAQQRQRTRQAQDIAATQAFREAGYRAALERAKPQKTELTPAERRANARAEALGTAEGKAVGPKEPDTEAIMSPAAIQKRVEIFMAGGPEPSFGMGKAGVANRVAFNNALGNLPVSGAEVQTSRATYGAEKANLANLTRTQGAAKAFGETAEKNLNMVEDALKTLPDVGVQFINAPVRSLYRTFGSKAMSKFDTAMIPVRNEFTRLLNSPTAAGVITNDMRNEIRKILDPNATSGQIRTSIKILRQDFKNRVKSYDEEIAATKSKLSQIGSPEMRTRPPLSSFGMP